MTYSTVNTERENYGSVDAVLHTINITELDAAGVEEYAPGTATGLEDASEYGVSVRGQEDETVAVVWDHLDAELKVKNRDDGTDVANNTDVGEVMLEVVGV
jgi:hypothetical protein